MSKIYVILFTLCVGCSFSVKEINTKEEYADALKSHLNRYLHFPNGQYLDMDCSVDIVQNEIGEVLSVELDKCEGSNYQKKTLLKCMYKASPLPLPDKPELFDSEIRMNFLKQK